MDKPPRRKVLSLSLSQPGKHQKKPRLKRNVSANSEKETEASALEDSHLISEERDEASSNLLPSCPVDSKLPEIPTDTLPSNSKRIAELSTLQQGDAYVTNRRGIINSESTIGKNKHQSSNSISREGEPDNCLEKPVVNDVHIEYVEKTPCNKKHIEKGPLKESSFNSTENVCHGDVTLNENVVPRCSKNTGTPSKSSGPCPSTSTVEIVTVVEENSTTSLDVPSATADSYVRPTTSTEKSIPAASSGLNNNCIQVLQCPLCYRKFDKMSTKTTHLKGCATKNKVTTQQLLEALELQQRQAAERRALGLPGFPLLAGNIRRPAAPKKENRAASKMDSNLQLAMALSLSLQDQEQTMEGLRKTPPGVSLDQFGFTIKPLLEAAQPRTSVPASRGKGKGSEKKIHPLLTRTAEERQRIITEKVAMVLLSEVESGKTETIQGVDLKSTFLQECQDQKNILWAKSHTSPSKNDRASYYVNGLREFISPSKVEMGSKVIHLSQVVNRYQTPIKDQIQKRIVEVTSTSPSDGENSSDSCSSQLKEVKSSSHIEMELRAKLFNDWAGMVNNSTMSDVTIYPQEGRAIPAHKIILHVRCPRILQAISRQRNSLTGNEVEVIMWSKTPHSAALAFLEFIYCGSVKSIRVLSQDLTCIFNLANEFKITDLTRYLNALSQNAQSCVTPSQMALSVVRDCTEDSPLLQEDSENYELVKEVEAHDVVLTPVVKEDQAVTLRKQSRASADVFACVALTPTRSETESIYSVVTVKGTHNPSSCSSPDMFGDYEVSQSPQAITEEAELVSHNQGNLAAISTVKDFLDQTKSRNNFEETKQPPSPSVSVSSEKTVLVERNSPVPSPSASISSEKTEIFEKNFPPSSPALSSSSVATEILDCNQDVAKQISFSLNDSKRKHSSGSQEGDTSACKRPCPISPNPSHEPEKKDSDVECLDLTQDSDVSNSSPRINLNLSEESCDQICISSDNETSELEINTNVELDKEDNLEVITCSSDRQCSESDKTDKSKVPISNQDPTEQIAENYVSPVWDGFEDLNFDDPLLFTDHPVNSGSPGKVTSERGRSPSGSCNQTVVNDNLCQSPKLCISPTKNCKLSENSDVESSSDCEMIFPGQKVTCENPQPSTSFEALLNDSLNINDSVLRQAESEFNGKLTQRETKGTPVNRILCSEPDSVTPLANYSAMKTPELKRELKRFGLKPTLGKRKGKIMLRHIYNELHPWVPSHPDKRLQDNAPLSQPSCSSKSENLRFSLSQPNSRKLRFSHHSAIGNDVAGTLSESQSSESDLDSDGSESFKNTSLQEIQYLEGDSNDTETFETFSQALHPIDKADLRQVVTDFITQDPELHQKVLEYEPIWIEKLRIDLRGCGFKFKMDALMAFLDEKCITFRSTQGGTRTKKRKPREINLKKKTVSHTGSDINEQL